MTDELVNRSGREVIQHRPEAPLERAGKEASGVAASYVAADYLSRKAANTIRTQAAALALFADYLDAAGGLGGNMRHYAAAVGSFSDADVDNVQPDLEAWRGVTWGLVEGFIKWLLSQGYSVASVNNRLSAVKAHSKLAAKADVINSRELALIKDVSGYSGKEAKRIYERRGVTRVGDKNAEHTGLTTRQAEKLKSMTADELPQAVRDRLLMCLLLDHGLRVSEVAGLRVTDFNLLAAELSFYRPKVDKTQAHRLTADTLRTAQVYMTECAP